LLLTSANALRQAGEGLAALRSLPVRAVGEATAAAARRAGLQVVDVGQAGVDELLASAPPEMRLLHLSGEHRRNPANARQRIECITVYRSRALPAPGIEMVCGAVAALHSPRAAARLAELADAGLRSTLRLAAISETTAAAAGQGWGAIGVAANPNDGDLLALAARLCQKPEPK
jgi:uroporphyrinogen-III synthase